MLLILKNRGNIAALQPGIVEIVQHERIAAKGCQVHEHVLQVQLAVNNPLLMDSAEGQEDVKSTGRHKSLRHGTVWRQVLMVSNREPIFTHHLHNLDIREKG